MIRNTGYVHICLENCDRLNAQFRDVHEVESTRRSCAVGWGQDFYLAA